MPPADRTTTSTRTRRAMTTNGSGATSATTLTTKDRNDVIAAIDAATAEAWRLRARDPEHAGRAATEALERAEAIGYDRGVADALTTLAYDDMRRAHYPDGQEKGKRALKIYRAE